MWDRLVNEKALRKHHLPKGHEQPEPLPVNTITEYHNPARKVKEIFMISKNAVKKAESMKGKINTRFSISHSQLEAVVNHYPGCFETGLAFFRLGYMQGMKAAKAEQKREAATGHEGR